MVNKSGAPKLAPAPAPISEGRMKLSAISRGKRRAPDKLVVVGVEGVGKSTFGAEAPNSIFISAEDGIRHLDVASFPEPQSFADVIAAIDELASTEHDFRTIVLDSLDWIEPLAWKEVIDQAKVNSIEEVGGGYGKGYTAAVDKFRFLLSRLDFLRMKKGMEVILLLHVIVKKFANPAGADHDRFIGAINEKSYNLVKQWADAILFATFEDSTMKEKSGRIKGISTGGRIAHTERHAAWDAKNRWALPPTIPFSYADWKEAREAGFQGNAAEILAACLELAETLKVPSDHPVRAWFEKNKDDAAELGRGLNRLRVKASEAGVSA